MFPIGRIKISQPLAFEGSHLPVSDQDYKALVTVGFDKGFNRIATLVMSFWKVPDKQTQELMEDFYKRILAGQPRAEALREAQAEPPG